MMNKIIKKLTQLRYKIYNYNILYIWIFCFFSYKLLLWGCKFVTGIRNIMVSLPDNLVEEVDFIVSMEEKNRSEFVREAMKLYIREKKKLEVSEKLKDGYVEMSKINLSFAEMGLGQDMEELDLYEVKLTGCEKM